MAINKNHLFEDLDGVKCAVVEAGVSQARVDFLKPLLEGNGFTVVVVAEPVKAAPVVAPAAAAGVTPAAGAAAVPVPVAEAGAAATESSEIAPPAPQPTTFKIGVSDVSFNATNAIFGRLLRTREGRVVTMAYWLQKEATSKDEVPYFDWKK